ncbi:hypothetical protein [Aliiroseovarius subalbicans]|nr:hypothetical protein [Aliiroseovarius subalbicans]
MNTSGFSDALLFYSISYKCQHEGVASLAGIIAAEDAINRSAPTLDELNAGLSKLHAAGLIERMADGFCTTGAGTKLYEIVNAGDGDVFSRLEKLASLIGAPNSLGGVSPEVSASEYQSAYSAYYGLS